MRKSILLSNSLSSLGGRARAGRFIQTITTLLSVLPIIVHKSEAMTIRSISNNNESSPTSTSSKPSPLKGVIFDMDGTLTKPNLDFGEMYRRCGVAPSDDILEEIAKLPSPEEQQKRLDIIDEMEEEGRRTLELMPGALELIHWLHIHNIPMAMVTRNTQKTTDVFVQRLLQSKYGVYTFHKIITRDSGFPPKPDPESMKDIANLWGLSLPSDNLLMIGDSMPNDIGYGQNAGIRTALLDTEQKVVMMDLKSSSVSDGTTKIVPDIVVDSLWSLPRQLWLHEELFFIQGKLGNSMPTLPKVPQPSHPTSTSAPLIHAAAANGDIPELTRILHSTTSGNENNDDDIGNTVKGISSSNTNNNNVNVDINEVDSNGNTALIWAAEKNQEEAMKLLLSYRDSSDTSTAIDLDHQGYLGATAVARASRRGFDNILNLLLEAGADPNISNEKLQYPLHFASFQRHLSTVRILLKYGANPLVLDRKGRTPAQDTSDEEICTLLQKAESKIRK